MTNLQTTPTVNAPLTSARDVGLPVTYILKPTEWHQLQVPECLAFRLLLYSIPIASRLPMTLSAGAGGARRCPSPLLTPDRWDKSIDTYMMSRPRHGGDSATPDMKPCTLF